MSVRVIFVIEKNKNCIENSNFRTKRFSIQNSYQNFTRTDTLNKTEIKVKVWKIKRIHQKKIKI